MSKTRKKKKRSSKNKGGHPPKPREIKRRPVKINSLLRAITGQHNFKKVVEINKCAIMFERRSGVLNFASSKWETIKKNLDRIPLLNITFRCDLFKLNFEEGLNLQRKIFRDFGKREGREIYLEVIKKAHFWRRDD